MEPETQRSSRLKRSKVQVQETSTSAQVLEDEDGDEYFDVNDMSDMDIEHDEGGEGRKTTRKKLKTKHEVESPNTREGTTLNKRPATTSTFRCVRGRRGFLQHMNDMPLDILYEIFGELEPIDLLYLSWSCKSLRAIVMNKSAKFLWLKAYKSLENQPPPCPSDINYAQYTRFLFVNRCMVCQTAAGSSTHDYSWGLRLKVCRTCILRTDLFIPPASIKHIYVSNCGIALKRGRIVYYPKSVKELEERLSNDPQFRLSFNYEEHEEDYRRKNEDKGDYERWRIQVVLSRNKDLEHRRQARREAIFEKLDEIGWQKEKILEYLPFTKFNMENLPTFRRSSKLTEKEWATIGTEIVSILEGGKQKRKQLNIEKNCQAFVTTFKKWYFNMKSNKFYVRFKAVPLDFVVNEPFLSRVLNFNEEATFPLNKQTSKTFRLFHKECRGKARQVLFNLLPDDIKQLQTEEMKDSTDVLHLASVWFRSDAIPRDYLSILSAVKTPLEVDETHEILKYEGNLNVKSCTQFKRSSISFDYKAHELAKHFIQASARDPNTTVASVMKLKSSNIKIRCTLCTTDYTWTNAIRHSIQHHIQANGESPAWYDIFSLQTNSSGSS